MVKTRRVVSLRNARSVKCHPKTTPSVRRIKRIWKRERELSSGTVLGAFLTREPPALQERQQRLTRKARQKQPQVTAKANCRLGSFS